MNIFEGQVCLVTGAAAGIGFALSEALLDAGAHVCLSDCDAGSLVAAAERLRRHGDRVSTAIADVSDKTQIDAAIDKAAARGRLDALFNNAGIGGTIPIVNATLEEWRRIIDINLWGVIHGVRRALPIMLAQKSGRIVNVSSIAGLVPLPYQSLYAATKYAVVGFSECLRLELAPDGVAVSVACPGNVSTEIWRKAIMGSEVDAQPPQDSISAQDAARIILDGVARNEGVIAFPEEPRKFWRAYCEQPGSLEPMLQDMERQRRALAASRGLARYWEAGVDERFSVRSPSPD